MSAVGYQQTSQCAESMSALPPKAAATVADRRVRFGPEGDIPLSGHSSQFNSWLVAVATAGSE